MNEKRRSFIKKLLNRSQKRRQIFLILISFSLILNLPCFSSKPVLAEEGLQIFNLGLIIHDMNATEREWCMNWIRQFDPFAKWNFILWQPYHNLDDEAFVEFLKARGLLIGADGYMQLLSTQERENLIDKMVNAFAARNIVLKGFFMFQPDTYTMNYAYSTYDFEYFVGYCFDQYLIDYMTMKGGWQLPYYHSADHALKPAQDNKGLVVFPHATWDWVSSFTFSHHLSTQVLGVYPQIYSEPSQAIDYCLRLIDETLSCSQPFGYAAAMFEWVWIINRQDLNETATEYYRQIINRYGLICQLYNETASWFKTNYPVTPTYHVSFTSPYDNQHVEWYLDLNHRIARVGDYVCSYLVFDNQIDRWSSNVAYVNFGEAPSETNCIDNSLEFEIDDLGGGLHRDIPRGDSVYYTGDLDGFPVYYETVMFPLSVYTFKNDIPITANITLLNKNKLPLETVSEVSFYEWLLHPRKYHVQASMFYNSRLFMSEVVEVNLTEHVFLSIKFLFGNLTVSCIDVENHPLANCTLTFSNLQESHLKVTDASGITTLEAYYGNWTVKAYKMGVSVGEAKIFVNQTSMDLTIRCNVGDVTVIVCDQHGPIEAGVFLKSIDYGIVFSGVIRKPMENITFTQIPLLNYTLTVESPSQTLTFTVDTTKNRQIQAMQASVTEFVDMVWFEIVIYLLIGTLLGSLTTWLITKRKSS